MPEYIERESLLEIAKKHQGNPFGAPLIIKAIEQAPAVDVTEVKHGDWDEGKSIAGYLNIRCSVCNNVFLEQKPNWGYCPACGAKLGGKVVN